MLYKILYVDDETANLRLIERLLRGTYEVITAASGAEALESLSLHDISLIISDQRMPGMTGIEFLKKAAELRPQTVRIMLTGYTDAEALVEAINSGVVYKYVTKPWDNEILRQTIKRALQHHETLKAQRQLQLHNERLQARLTSMKAGIVRIIGEMLDIKDPQARSHAERTSELAVELGRKMNLGRADLEQLSLAAFLHEAADIRIPSHVVFKDTPLTAIERQIVQQTFELGIQLLEGIPEFEEVVEILHFNHENYNGSGFPMGFSYDQIPLFARIIAVANAYDTLTSRTANSRLSPEDAQKRLSSMSGTRLDPMVVNAFCSPESAIPMSMNDLETACA